MANILLVEDDDMISRMLSLRLGMAGHTVSVAVNGREGVNSASGGEFDLVLMDMHMPEMDGHEAVRTLRAGGYAGLIVAVTASAMSSDSQKAIASGCDGFISKPVGGDFEQQVESFLSAGG